jgi:peroxiredoxin
VRNRRRVWALLLLAAAAAAPCRTASAEGNPVEQAVVEAEGNPGRIPAARAAVDEALKAQPKAAWAYVLDGRLLLAESKSKKGAERSAGFAKALGQLDKATALDPWDANPFRVRVNLFRAQGSPDHDALLEALRAIAIRLPGDLTAREEYVRAGGKVVQLQEGDPMPRVVWKTASGADVPAASLYANGIIVIELYRTADWCPICRKQLNVIEDNLEPIARAGASVVAASPDAPEIIAAVEKDGLKGRKPFRLRLLVDSKGAVADALGFLNPETVKPGVRPEAYGLPYPTTIIVDQKGIVRFVKSHGDFTQRVKPEEMIAVVKKIRAESGAK